eukprot:GHRR01008791.1.p1 GENE.GHRR01008791.1~~GHRR01008791.1.p1  ORF type:complete len:323 (+),score=94.73 GHRR01008791.1:85-1053(+)
MSANGRASEARWCEHLSESAEMSAGAATTTSPASESAAKAHAPNMKQAMTAAFNTSATAYTELLDNKCLLGIYEMFVDHVVALVADNPEAQILDIASASGEPAVGIARKLSSARVVASDIADGMVDSGRKRTAGMGITNVEWAKVDAEDISAFQAHTFDAVTCSLGLMFMEMTTAVNEFGRVLKPRGGVALSVWQTVDKFPLANIFASVAREFDEASATRGALEIATRFGDPKPILQALEASGFTNIQCKEIEVKFQVILDNWLDILFKMPFPLKAAIAACEARGEADVRERMGKRLKEVLAEGGYLVDEGKGVCIPNNHAW